MPNKKILILGNSSVFPSSFYNQYGVDYYPFYTDKLGFILRIIRRVTMRNRFLRKKLWYGKWFKDFVLYDEVIIYAKNGIDDVINDIDQVRNGRTPKLYFWDPVFSVNECMRIGYPKWSFDPTDCTFYGMLFNNTFYFKLIRDKYFDPSIKPRQVVYFTGLKKGREDQLVSWGQKFREIGIDTNFLVFEQKERKRVSFEENILNILHSAILLDVVQDGQKGQTVRVMESIYFERKLLTTNDNIINEEFYNPDNIFILGVNNFFEIIDFLNRPYNNQHTSRFVEEYDFPKWINRFL